MTEQTTQYRTITRDEATPGMHARLTMPEGARYYAVHTSFGTWVSLADGLTIHPGPRTTIEVAVEPEPTEEQRAAVEWLRAMVAMSPFGNPGVILDALPSSLTAPAPALPTEAGRYEDRKGDGGWEVYEDGTWHYNGGVMQRLSRVQQLAPFRRLVPERPPVTREQAFVLVTAYAEQMVDEHEHADAIVALANGTDQ